MLKRYAVFTNSVLAVAFSLSGFVFAEPDPNFHIYLALGQSNMQGAAHLPDNPISHSRVRVLQGENCSEHSYAYGTWRSHFQPVIRCHSGDRTKPDGTSGPIGLSPVDTFAVTMAEAAGENVTIGLVGAAYGGSDIRAHLPNCADFNLCDPPYGDVNGAPVVNGTTPMYLWVLELAKKAQEVGVIKGIIFHHGESNAGQQEWLNYVDQYITQLRSDLNLNPEDVPFIAGELPRTGCCASVHNPLIHQLPNYIENTYWVSSGPMEDGTVLGDRSDSLHWSTFSVIEMGKRYAAKMLEVQGGNVDVSSSVTLELEDYKNQSLFLPLSVVDDSSASGGQYIVWPENGTQVLSSPSDSESGQVSLSFNLSTQADVSFVIQANFSDGTNDSFYYKLDNGNWQTQNAQNTSGWQAMNVATFTNVAAGSHTLKILRREDGSKLDFAKLSASTGKISAGSSLTVELESFNSQSLFWPLVVQSDSLASNGQYVVWPENNGQYLASPADSETGQIAVSFNLSQSSSVELAVTASFSDAMNDSFYYKLDQNAWQTQNLQTTSGWDTLPVATFSGLSSGAHTLRILRREDGSALDKIKLTVTEGVITE